MTSTAPLHNTSAPLLCCVRCHDAEIGRRSKRRPTMRYSQTASTGSVDVLHGSTLVATLEKDDLFGIWSVRPATTLRQSLQERLRAVPGGDRRETLDATCHAYIAAWKAGEA